MAMSLYLFAALLMSAGTVMASNNPSGLWNISYEVQWGSAESQLANSSVASIYEEGSTLRGESSLGSRKGGSLIGLSNGSTFDATITFRQKPSLFMRLAGGCTEDSLQGTFTATSTEGGFWRGQFTATQAGEAVDFKREVDPLDYMTRNVVVVPEPTVFLDPEAFYYDQADKAQREKFAIKYARNTILMCRNKPMLWQWWL
jgi:hypothetical protein